MGNFYNNIQTLLWTTINKHDTWSIFFFFYFLHEQLNFFTGKTIIVEGDFIDYLNPKLDNAGGWDEYSVRQAQDTLTFSLLIVFPDKKYMYKLWNKGKASLIQSRLDMFLISEHFQYQNVTRKVLPAVLSDDSLIQIEIYTGTSRIEVWDFGTLM